MSDTDNFRAERKWALGIGTKKTTLYLCAYNGDGQRIASPTDDARTGYIWMATTPDAKSADRLVRYDIEFDAFKPYWDATLLNLEHGIENYALYLVVHFDDRVGEYCLRYPLITPQPISPVQLDPEIERLVAPVGQSEHRLTDDERAVLDHLAEAWDAFVKLPKQHPYHGSEFAGFIHNAQRMIMSRVVARQERWVKTDSRDASTT